MKRILAIILTVMVVLSAAGTVFAANPFDVPAKHWAYDAVAKLAKAGIIDGYGEGAFRGDQLFNRYEMAQIVANAMSHASKADAGNKDLIDKLAVEFETELRTLGTQVKKLEDRTVQPAKSEAKPNLSVQSETLFQMIADNPPGNTPRLRGNDAWQWRERLYLNAAVNPTTIFDARLQTGVANFGTKAANNANGNDVQIDRAYFTTVNSLGVDKIVWGRQPILWGQGFLSWKTGSNDGATIYKKLGNATNLQVGAYIVNPEPAPVATLTGDSQELQFAALGFQVNPDLKVTTSYYNNNQSQLASKSPYNYGFAKSNGWDVSFAQKIGKFTFLGEYVNTDLNGASGNFAGNNPRAYSLAITNGTNLPQYFYPAQRFIVDYKKPHTDGFELQYRSIEKGAVPNGFGSPNGTNNVSPLYTINGVAPGMVDNTKGYFFVYENVLAKGIVLSLEYQNLKFKDTGAAFDEMFKTSLQMVF